VPHKDPETRRQYEQARYARRKREGTLPVRTGRVRTDRPLVARGAARTTQIGGKVPTDLAERLQATLDRLNTGGRFRSYGRIRRGADGTRLSKTDVLNDALEDWINRTNNLHFMADES
jgi:hypothetical protein